MERARRYKGNSSAAHDEMVSAFERASGMTAEQVRALVAAAVALVGSFWQVSHPTPAPALYEQVPEWGHVAYDFKARPRLAAAVNGHRTCRNHHAGVAVPLGAPGWCGGTAQADARRRC